MTTVREFSPTKPSLRTWVSFEPRNGVWLAPASSARMHSCRRTTSYVSASQRWLEDDRVAKARQASGRPKRCKLAHAFRWEYSYKKLKLAQLLGQHGVFLTVARRRGPKACDGPSGRTVRGRRAPQKTRTFSARRLLLISAPSARVYLSSACGRAGHRRRRAPSRPALRQGGVQAGQRHAPTQGRLRVLSDCHFRRKKTTEYDRKPGIKWLNCVCTHCEVVIGYDPGQAGRGAGQRV